MLACARGCNTYSHGRVAVPGLIIIGGDGAGRLSPCTSVVAAGNGGNKNARTVGAIWLHTLNNGTYTEQCTYQAKPTQCHCVGFLTYTQVHTKQTNYSSVLRLLLSSH